MITFGLSAIFYSLDFIWRWYVQSPFRYCWQFSHKAIDFCLKGHVVSQLGYKFYYTGTWLFSVSDIVRGIVFSPFFFLNSYADNMARSPLIQCTQNEWP